MATLLCCGCKEYKETRKLPHEQEQVALTGLVEPNSFGQNPTPPLLSKVDNNTLFTANLMGGSKNSFLQISTKQLICGEVKLNHFYNFFFFCICHSLLKVGIYTNLWGFT